MNAQEIKKLSTSERIQMMETLWESLLYDEGAIDTPNWHGDILKKRMNSIKTGKAKFIPLSELKLIQNK
jgi:putative addiction module component (TIGR02574 family)